MAPPPPRPPHHHDPLTTTTPSPPRPPRRHDPLTATTPSNPSLFTLLHGLGTGVIISVTFGAFTIFLTLVTLLSHLVYKRVFGLDREWLKRLQTDVLPATNRIRGRRGDIPLDLSGEIDE